MYQVNRAAWDRGLVSKAAMGDNLNKALWNLEIIVENHHRQHDVPCSSSFIIIVDPISTFPKKSSSRWWPGPAEPLPSPQQLLCSSFPSQLRPVKSELKKIQFVLKLLANYYMTTNTSSQSTACTVQFGKALAMAMLEKENDRNLFLQIFDTPLSAGNLWLEIPSHQPGRGASTAKIKNHSSLLKSMFFRKIV